MINYSEGISRAYWFCDDLIIWYSNDSDDSMAYPAVAANVTLHILGDEATPIKSGLVRKQKMGKLV